MPSSGTASFTITRDELINSSLRLIRVLRETDVANGAQIRTGNIALNMLLKSMQSNGLQLWTYQLLAIPMQIGKLVYTIGPVGADVTSVRPLRLFDGSFVRNTACTPYIDTPLRLISRQEYLQYGNKSVQAIPNSIYYQPNIDYSTSTSPSLGHGELYIYLTSSLTTYTIYANFQRPIYDIDEADQEFDLPQEWFRGLKFLLAADLSYEYPQVDPRVAKDVRDKAEELHDSLQDWSTDTASMTLQPDPMVMNSYNR